MSLYSALRAGVSGLSAQTQAMSMISDNISNVNTTGYKTVRARFSSLVGTGGIRGTFSAGVVSSIAQRAVSGAGQVTSSDTNTHVAINGQGFFAVASQENVIQDSNGNWTNNGEVLYTRVGDFSPDANGNLTNSSGHVLLGWARNATNSGYEATNLQSDFSVINVAGTIGQPVPTQRIDLSANLDATMVDGQSFTMSAPIYSQQGGVSNIEYRFTKQPNPNGSTATSRKFKVEARITSGTAQLVNGTNPINVPVEAGGTAREVNGVATPLQLYGTQMGQNRREMVLNYSGLVELNTGRAVSDIKVRYTSNGATTVLDTRSVSIVGGKVTLTLSGELPEDATNLELFSEGPSPLSYAIDATATPPVTGGTTLNSRALSIPTQSAGGTVFTRISTHYDVGIVSFDSNGLNPTISALPGTFTAARAGSISGTGVLSMTVDHAADGEGTSTTDSDDVRVTMNFSATGSGSGLTSYQSLSTIYAISQDGSAAGDLAGIEVSSQGEIQAIFNRGTPRYLAQIALISFNNPNSLLTVNGNAYRVSEAAGLGVARAPGTGDTGTVAGASLESSNADVATEFTEMIVVQRAYSASTKIITTADEMLEDIIRAKR